jgi:hypothetical protein
VGPLSGQGKLGTAEATMNINRAQVEQGIFNAVIVGEFELRLAQHHFIELLDEAVRMNAPKVLIDGRQATGNPTAFERFLYGTFAATATLEALHKHNVRLKFAYVIHEPLRDSEGFGETVAINRGMDVKTFGDKNEAVKWLNEGP